MKLVLDTDVIVAAMRSPTGASAEILRRTRRREVSILVSVPLALEYEAICQQSEHRAAAELSENEVEVFLNALLALAEPVTNHFLWRPQLRDPGDEMVLEAAVNGGANALVTFNVRDYGVMPPRFGIALLSPREAMNRIRE